METKNTLETIYIDLRKLSEEQIKEIGRVLIEDGCQVWEESLNDLKSGYLDSLYPFLSFNKKDNEWMNYSDEDGKTELTYPDFIKLFEGGEGETEVQKLKKQIDLYKECFELFIPIDKFDEANEFLSTNKNPLAKHLSRVQKEVEKKPKF